MWHFLSEIFYNNLKNFWKIDKKVLHTFFNRKTYICHVKKIQHPHICPSKNVHLPKSRAKREVLRKEFCNHLIFYFSYWCHFSYSWYSSSTPFYTWYLFTDLPNPELMVNSFKKAYSCFESSVPFIFSLIKIQLCITYVFPFTYFCFEAPDFHHLNEETLPTDFSTDFSMRTAVCRHFEDRDCIFPCNIYTCVS